MGSSFSVGLIAAFAVWTEAGSGQVAAGAATDCCGPPLFVLFTVSRLFLGRPPFPRRGEGQQERRQGWPPSRRYTRWRPAAEPAAGSASPRPGPPRSPQVQQPRRQAEGGQGSQNARTAEPGHDTSLRSARCSPARFLPCAGGRPLGLTISPRWGSPAGRRSVRPGCSARSARSRSVRWRCSIRPAYWSRTTFAVTPSSTWTFTATRRATLSCTRKM